MNRTLVILLALGLVGCGTTPRETPVVVQATEVPAPNVPEVKAPPKPTFPKIRFQKPTDKGSIVALDVNNLTALNETLVILDNREKQWQSRLNQANQSIRILKKPLQITPGNK